jgi:hypothetical protein
MKKIDRNRMKLISSELEGELYSCFSPTEKNNKPIIFINDQVTDKFHIGAFSYGLNRKVMPSDNIFCYDETYHKPYIWVPKHVKFLHYDEHKADAYAKSLIISLEMNRIGEADLLGMGLGGIVGMYATVSPRIEHLIAAHPPITSMPVANIDLLRKYADNYRRKLICHALNVLLNEQISFIKENAKGYPDLARRARLQKIEVVGSSTVNVPGLPKIDTLLSDYLFSATGTPNDGMVLWEPEKLKQMGFKVSEDTKPTSHLRMLRSPEYEKDVYKKLILRK